MNGLYILHQSILGFMEVDNRVKKIKEFLELQKKATFTWESSGLLDGLDSKESGGLALKLEELREILLNGNFVFDERIYYLIFPIVTRSFREYKYLINDCLAVLNYVNSKIANLPTEWDYSNIDIEAQFCNLMAEEIARLKL